MIIVEGNGDTYQGHGIGYLSNNDLEGLDTFGLAQIVLPKFLKPSLSLIKRQAIQGVGVELLGDLTVGEGMRGP